MTRVFVSDRTHMLRVLRMAEGPTGIQAWGSPTPTELTIAAAVTPRADGLGRLTSPRELGRRLAL